MGTSFFSSDGALHQVLRTGSVVTDLGTGRSGFVISEDRGGATIADDRGGLHQVIRTGSVSTDLSTGKTWFEL
jgi:hypothetical protein